MSSEAASRGADALPTAGADAALLVSSSAAIAAPPAVVVLSACPYDRATVVESVASPQGQIDICPYAGESQIIQLIELIAPQLSEPYSIFTYRFFLEGWRELCFLAHCGDRMVGAIVSKADMKNGRMRGYVAMLVVDPDFRKAGIGMRLAVHSINKMRETCDEVGFRVGPPVLG